MSKPENLPVSLTPLLKFRSCPDNVLLATEGARLGAIGEDARRLIMARMVLDHRRRAGDPLATEGDNTAAVAALLNDDPADLAAAQALAV